MKEQELSQEEQEEQDKYDVAVFAQSTEEELKATVTYKDFIENDIRFIIKKLKKGYSIYRPSGDIRFIE